MTGPVPRTNHSRRTPSASQILTTIATLTRGMRPFAMRLNVEIPSPASSPNCRKDPPRSRTCSFRRFPIETWLNGTRRTVAHRSAHGPKRGETILMRIDPRKDHYVSPISLANSPPALGKLPILRYVYCAPNGTFQGLARSIHITSSREIRTHSPANPRESGVTPMSDTYPGSGIVSFCLGGAS